MKNLIVDNDIKHVKAEPILIKFKSYVEPSVMKIKTDDGRLLCTFGQVRGEKYIQILASKQWMPD